jgi:hypothetical protein
MESRIHPFELTGRKQRGYSRDKAVTCHVRWPQTRSSFTVITHRARVSTTLDGDSSHHPTQKLSWFPLLIPGPNKMSLFDGVTFFCTSTLSDKRKAELTLLLEHNGARPVLLGEATHIITHSLDYEGQDGAKEGSVTVTVRLS